MTGEKDDGHMGLFLHQARGLNAVDLASQAHVHDDQLGPQLRGHGHRLRAFAGHAADAVAEAGERFHQVLRDDAFILDDEDGRRMGLGPGSSAAEDVVIWRRALPGRAIEAVARLHVEQSVTPPGGGPRLGWHRNA